MSDKNVAWYNLVAELTRKDKVLERFYTYGASTRVDQQQVGRLERSLPRCRPESKLAIIFALLV